MISMQPENLFELTRTDPFGAPEGHDRGMPAERHFSSGEPENFEEVDLTVEELQSISHLVGIICVGAHANFNWLRGCEPNAEAARRTASRLIAQTQELRQLVVRLRPLACEQ